VALLPASKGYSDCTPYLRSRRAGLRTSGQATQGQCPRRGPGGLYSAKQTPPSPFNTNNYAFRASAPCRPKRGKSTIDGSTLLPPAVSVLITSLNRPHFLQVACESVLSQDYSDIEVIICDDASDNDAARACTQRLASQDARVIVLQNDERLGQFRTIVNASRLMRGRYFAILNDDDRWEPGFLSALLTPLEEDLSLVAAFCDHFIIDDLGNIDHAASDVSTKRCHRDQLAPGRHANGSYLAFGLSAFPTVVASLFRADAVDWPRYRGARMDVIGYYDLYLQACVLGGAAPVWFDSRRLSSYRVHTGQLSAQPNIPLSRAKAWIWEDCFAAADMTGVEKSIVQQLAATYHSLGMAYLRRGQTRVARQYLWYASYQAPRARSLAGLLLAHDSRLLAKLRARVL
jgi:glycosyltransferase involved in cell wall biosynthesis